MAVIIMKDSILHIEIYVIIYRGSVCLIVNL